MSKIKPPELEQELGMNVYTSKTEGIGGVVKQTPEDFVVEEITPEGRILQIDEEAVECSREGEEEKEYVHFTLQKYNWDTLRAVREISRRLRVSHKRLGFAGTKDKRALTTQRVSVWNKKIMDLEGVGIRDMVLRDFRYSDERINLGDLYGNRFTVVIRGLDLGEVILRERVSSVMDELRNQIPAFFGVQRFGTVRPITHLVGKEIIKGDFREAVLIYLVRDFMGEDEGVREVRKALGESGDFRGALRDFPKHLGYENAMLNHLVNAPEDYTGALRKLPKGLQQMFVHAYQGYIFNKALSEYLKRGIPVERLPLVGYRTEVDEITSGILDEEGIIQEDFQVSMRELSSKGEYRVCFRVVEDFEVIGFDVDELNTGRSKLTVGFTLQKGNYATVFLRELMKT
ncbi:MAG: tRNA pseudouridine(13) synthase TruD [Candidatus Altiarchaeota archaeon]|nr:tRNA pseudouridine(13) synthase TruD [Candidatus Altiarchaeota archaeon]